MDPNATLRALAELGSLCAIDDGHRAYIDAEITDTAIDLYEWIDSGGFEPDWEACPKGTSVYQYGY